MESDSKILPGYRDFAELPLSRNSRKARRKRKHLLNPIDNHCNTSQGQCILILTEFLKSQKAAITAEFAEQMSTCFGSITRRQLENFAKRRGWSVASLPGTDPRSVMVVKKTETAFPELWVHRRYGSHRKAFTAFLKHAHGYKESTLPRHLQVDHSVPKYRFKKNHPEHFIRLFLIDRKVNAAFGAGFEKSFYRRERNLKPSFAILLSWLTFLKLYGAIPPGKRKKPTVWEEWSMQQAEKMTAEGVSKKHHAYTGILGVLRLGYTGFYTGSSEGGTLDFGAGEPDIPYESPRREIQDQFDYELTAIDFSNCKVTYKISGDGEVRELPMRRALFTYDGKFKWGYGGTGPQFLAWSMLAHHYGHANFGWVEVELLLKNLLAELPFSPKLSPLHLSTEILEKSLANE